MSKSSSLFGTMIIRVLVYIFSAILFFLPLASSPLTNFSVLENATTCEKLCHGMATKPYGINLFDGKESKEQCNIALWSHALMFFFRQSFIAKTCKGVMP